MEIGVLRVGGVVVEGCWWGGGVGWFGRVVGGGEGVVKWGMGGKGDGNGNGY